MTDCEDCELREVYQVRVNDNTFLRGKRVDYESVSECFAAIEKNHYDGNRYIGDKLTITMCPNLSEEVCRVLNIPYEISVVYTIYRDL